MVMSTIVSFLLLAAPLGVLAGVAILDIWEVLVGYGNRNDVGSVCSPDRGCSDRDYRIPEDEAAQA